MVASDISAQIERHLNLMAVAPVKDEDTARQALAYALSAVGGMNQHLAVAEQPRTTPFFDPIDDIVKKLEEWIKRLFDKLTEIAKQLKASFSITVGTNISVTISCSPLDS